MTFMCTVTANPQASEYNFYKGGVQKYGGTGSRYYFQAQKSDTGSYKCRAKNSVKAVYSQHVYLNVRSKYFLYRIFLKHGGPYFLELNTYSGCKINWLQICYSFFGINCGNHFYYSNKIIM